MDLNTSNLSEADINLSFTSLSSNVSTLNAWTSPGYQSPCLSIATSDLCQPDSDIECWSDAQESSITISEESISKSKDEFGCYPITYSSDENENEAEGKHQLTI